MHHQLSLLGLFHTAVSVLPIGIGFVALFRDGKIDPRTSIGRSYLASMLVGTLTAFGLTRNGFNIGHVLSLITLVVLLSGLAAYGTQWFGRLSRYVETLSFSTSFLLLMIFATTETLTRLPVGHPIAANPDAPILGVVRFGLLIGYLAVVGYQVFTLRAAASDAQPAPRMPVSSLRTQQGRA